MSVDDFQAGVWIESEDVAAVARAVVQVIESGAAQLLRQHGIHVGRHATRAAADINRRARIHPVEQALAVGGERILHIAQMAAIARETQVGILQ